MDKLIVTETDRGHYSVRPSNWAGCWNEKGQIKESLNHTGLFLDKEDADKFAEWKNAEGQGLLVKLPCRIGDCVYKIIEQRDNFDDTLYKIISRVNFKYEMINDIGKTIFITREQAEQNLIEMT